MSAKTSHMVTPKLHTSLLEVNRPLSIASGAVHRTGSFESVMHVCVWLGACTCLLDECCVCVRACACAKIFAQFVKVRMGVLILACVRVGETYNYHTPPRHYPQLPPTLFSTFCADIVVITRAFLTVLGLGLGEPRQPKV